ncbi:MAG: non-hydrolyzing UDP-N-acetylglucosamine 2-epimerase [Clostridiaceae bacterium]
MGKLKLITIIGTRPEIIRLSSVIKCCDKYFNHILVHTGQNWDYTLNQVFFKDLELRNPDYFLNTVGKNLGETIGNIIAKSYDVIEKEKPDALLILGDTNSSLSAISAKRLKVPIFHMEAGNRCWDWNVSEMINRKIVDHISDINLPYTEHSRRYLLSEGVDGKTIFVTGSPMVEVLHNHIEKINSSDILKRLGLKKRNYLLLSAHREENIDLEDNFLSLMNSVNILAEKYQMPIIYSMHPRSKKFIEKRRFIFHPLVKSMNPFGFIDYNNLQMNAYCVLSDSGTLSEESAILDFPAVLIRTSTERPEVLDKGTVVIGGIKGEDVQQAVELSIKMHENDEKTIIATDYIDDNVSVKIVKLIQSYAKIINLTVWGKE